MNPFTSIFQDFSCFSTTITFSTKVLVIACNKKHSTKQFVSITHVQDKTFFAVDTLNSFVPNALILYPLKTSENRKETVGKNGLKVCEKRLSSD